MFKIDYNLDSQRLYLTAMVGQDFEELTLKSKSLWTQKKFTSLEQAEFDIDGKYLHLRLDIFEGNNRLCMAEIPLVHLCSNTIGHEGFDMYRGMKTEGFLVLDWEFRTDGRAVQVPSNHARRSNPTNKALHTFLGQADFDRFRPGDDNSEVYEESREPKQRTVSSNRRPRNQNGPHREKSQLLKRRATYVESVQMGDSLLSRGNMSDLIGESMVAPVKMSGDLQDSLQIPDPMFIGIGSANKTKKSQGISNFGQKVVDRGREGLNRTTEYPQQLQKGLGRPKGQIRQEVISRPETARKRRPPPPEVFRPPLRRRMDPRRLRRSRSPHESSRIGYSRRGQEINGGRQSGLFKRRRQTVQAQRTIITPQNVQKRPQQDVQPPLQLRPQNVKKAVPRPRQRLEESILVEKRSPGPRVESDPDDEFRAFRNDGEYDHDFGFGDSRLEEYEDDERRSEGEIDLERRPIEQSRKYRYVTQSTVDPVNHDRFSRDYWRDPR